VRAVTDKFNKTVSLPARCWLYNKIGNLNRPFTFRLAGEVNCNPGSKLKKYFNGPAVVTQFGSGKNEQLPAPTTNAGRARDSVSMKRALSAPETTVHRERHP